MSLLLKKEINGKEEVISSIKVLRPKGKQWFEITSSLPSVSW